jgi:hypothetical protein
MRKGLARLCWIGIISGSMGRRLLTGNNFGDFFGDWFCGFCRGFCEKMARRRGVFWTACGGIAGKSWTLNCTFSDALFFAGF